jgi:Ca2+-transporting ATPase
LRQQPALAARLAECLLSDDGIHAVVVNPLTGSVLVRFEPSRVTVHILVETVRAHARNGHPGSNGGGAPREAWHTLSVSTVLERLSTSATRGLTRESAQARLSAVGANRLPVPRPKSTLAILADHVTSLPVLLLGGAAALSIASGAALEAAAILAVVAANTTVGYLTERRVERILTSLQHATVPRALVRREGDEQIVSANVLVPGDVLALRAGHEVPADARVVETEGLAVDESALTGESAPVLKSAASLPDTVMALPDHLNMVHAGTLVAEGRGLAVVTATGRHTELGRMRSLVADTSTPPTPLERELETAGRRLVALSLGACAAALGLGVLRGIPLLEMARSAVSLAVAAVPEGLPAVATTTLALGTQRMLRRGTLVRRLAAVENLGAVTVVCADKTGTLTENRMAVDSWCVGSREYGQGPELAEERRLDAGLARALVVAVLCNEAELTSDGSDRGSSTESALLVAARQAGVDYRDEREKQPIVGIRRRSDGNNWMATVHAVPGGSSLVALKGAPEEVLARCDRWIDAGIEEPLTATRRREILTLNDTTAARGLRVLGLAFRETTAVEAPYDGMTWLGLVALTDPVRPSARDAVRACRAAGIRTVMITGDHARTAVAIYGELGRREGRPNVFDASRMGDLDDAALRGLVGEVDVFARVSPADKYRIVRALQAAGHVVAMTGDGVNDAAALRAADIGVAMGDRGTDIARDVADVVLMADDFGGMVEAVEQGRTIHANVGKALRFLLATNGSELLVTLGALALGIPRPMSAIQFLWINLLSDVAPALALAVEPAEPDLMARPPRDPAAPLLSRAALVEVGFDAGVLAAATLGVHGLAIARHGAGPHAATLAFSTLTAAQLLHAFTYRSRAAGASERSVLTGVVAGTLGAQVAAMALPPLRRALGLTPLTLADWALAAAGAVLPLVVNQLRPRADVADPTVARKGELDGSDTTNETAIDPHAR